MAPRLNMTDEERRERKRQQDRASHLRQKEKPGYYERRDRRKAYVGPISHRNEPRPEPPLEVIAERDRVFAVDRDPISVLLGEPAPGRRAIDQDRS